ncbi:MAG: M48 family metallopeptidase [Candidatus Eremiobacteraeota bacterium]|nr:M48 family metallopeptidase [Candidatus Eremiobacteraeota bacterium]
MNISKRIVAAATLLCLVAANLPVPARAVSTATEIRMGQDAAKQVDMENDIVSDPVLNNWVNGVAANLARYRARPDINYKFKIIQTNDINAFSLPGGFVYVNFGLLNFVDSNDELAGVMAHEMGHVERRHQVTLNAKAQVLNILLGVLSIASPFVYRFGNLIGGLSMSKLSRIDELQADQYGLQLMSRADYDPDAMVSFMSRLGKEYGDNGGGLDKYFESHPDPKARIAHLKGYPALSKTDTPQMLSQAIHDEDEGRYAYASYKLDNVLKADPSNQIALLHKGQVALALGNFDKSQIALSEVRHSPNATQAAQSAADRMMALLPTTSAHASLLKPNLNPVRTQLAAAEGAAKTAQISLDDRLKLARHDEKQFEDRLNNLSYEVPNFGNIDVRQGSRVEGVVFDLEHMAKDLNTLMDKADYVVSNSSGMLKDDTGVLNEMDAPLRGPAPSGQTLTVLPFYSDIVKQMTASSDGLVQGVTAARGAIALGWQAAPALDAYFRQLDRTPLDFGGDLSPRAAQDLKPLAVAAINQLDVAAAAAEEAQSLYFTAQSRQLVSRITLLGLGYSAGRYDALTRSIRARVGVEAPTYETALRLGMSPGDVGAACWLAAEEKVPVSTVINEQRATGKAYVDMALAKHLSQESLEVVMGLWWEGFAEKPEV